MKTQTVHISDRQEEFIRQSVADGNYADPGEVICDALRVLQFQSLERAAKLAALGRMLDQGFEGVDRGEFIEIDDDASLDWFIEELSTDSVAAQQRADTAFDSHSLPQLT